MPELPEVETIRRGLDRLIVGKTIASVHNFDSPKSFPNNPSDVERFLIGATITGVHRRAKVLLIDLSTGYTLVTHLKMTGQIVVIQQEPDSLHDDQNLPRVLPSGPPRQASPSLIRWGGGHPSDSFVHALPDNTTRQSLTFTDGTVLYFNDLRKFGWMKLIPSPILAPHFTGATHEMYARKQRGAQQAVDMLPRASTEAADTADAREFAAVIDFMKKVGPEPLEDSFTVREFIPRVRRRSGTTIKAAILDQTVLAGVGNIYADESLWGAYIHPATRVRDLSDEQLTTLLGEIKYVMNLSIDHGGSTDKNYVDAEGRKGSYLQFARVFRREGQACPRHPDVMIEKIRVAGRGTHICPVCQVVQ